MRQKLKNIPPVPGVYIFLDKKGQILYIGKAKNLKNRIKSHFRNIDNGNSVKQRMLKETTSINWQKTGSEIEALLRESEFIKTKRPKYNILLRDDKNYFFVGFTKEKFSRVFITHQPVITRVKNLKTEYIGPFTDGSALKKSLKLLRPIFPYCVCKNLHRNKCLNAHLDRCFGFCCSIDESLSEAGEAGIVQYKRNIQSIKHILNGKSDALLKKMKRDMLLLAAKERFEEAVKTRDDINNLEKVFKHGRVFQEMPEVLYRDYHQTQIKLQKILKTQKNIQAIEAYDIANIQGKQAAASLVVFLNGRPQKSFYKKFRIRGLDLPNDIAMIKEVLSRRMKRKDWPLPDLIVLDGGRGQLNAAKEIIGNKVPICAIAKKDEELYTLNSKISLKKQDRGVLFLLQNLRDEAHRFARTYHHYLRSRALI